MQDKLTYVILALPQRRDMDRKYVQPIVKIAAEFIARDQVGQIAMSSGYKTDIDAMCSAAAQSLKLLFLSGICRWRFNETFARSRPQLLPGRSVHYS